MIYFFEQFELDTTKLELRENGISVAVEPQVFALLRFLVENRDRAVTREDIIAAVWDGRIVSDSAVSSRIKSARQAIGDSGSAQRFIKTIHGTGFRFLGEVRAGFAPDHAALARADEAAAESDAAPPSERPSIAVLPFAVIGSAAPRSALAEALPQDLTTDLSRLRWLFVIARPSAFRFHSRDLDLDRVRAELNVRYCLSGAVESLGNKIAVSVELADTQDHGVVWSDRFTVEVDGVHDVRTEIVSAVLNALELQIPLNEARRARLKPPQHLDSWSAYHLGLQHMYRFTKQDNDAATALFKRAAALDPDFSRAYAGLSFTHFQDAFLNYSHDSKNSTQLARSFAEQSLERDPLDPFGTLTMGRSFVLRGDIEGALPWLERANALNPNYAQAKYSRAWTESMLGLASPSQCDVDEAMALSPLDPLRYAMLAVRAFSHLVLDQPDKAAKWAEQAARSPGAHVLIELIAVVSHAQAGDDAKARAWAESARARAPEVNKADFMRAFPFRDSAKAAGERCTKMLERYGF